MFDPVLVQTVAARTGPALSNDSASAAWALSYARTYCQIQHNLHTPKTMQLSAGKSLALQVPGELPVNGPSAALASRQRDIQCWYSCWPAVEDKKKP